ncbi:hypothetical protein [Chishuiella sp.]|uniref:hypothetical protein n=1 Tax=Chishuiella sp. TaxID=1969467 RepID=UPI0028A7953D|nr:hypothetical protein [Chishuiella sp.]
MRFIAFVLILFCLQIKAQNTDKQIELIRNNYTKAVNDKALCAEMIKELETLKDNPIYLGYLGSLQIIWAKHIINPFGKLKTFKKGKINLEKAILIEPYNTELRFIRLTIQKNAPRFLNYHENIKEDETFLEKNIKKIPSSILQNYTNAIIKN